MKSDLFERLREHLGHKLVVVTYGDPLQPDRMAIECEDCEEVLVEEGPAQRRKRA